MRFTRYTIIYKKETGIIFSSQSTAFKCLILNKMQAALTEYSFYWGKRAKTGIGQATKKEELGKLNDPTWGAMIYSPYLPPLRVYLELPWIQALELREKFYLLSDERGRLECKAPGKNRVESQGYSVLQEFSSNTDLKFEGTKWSIQISKIPTLNTSIFYSTSRNVLFFFFYIY